MFCDAAASIQIQPMLRLNRYDAASCCCFFINSNTTNVKVKPEKALKAMNRKIYSNTTNVKVKQFQLLMFPFF